MNPEQQQEIASLRALNLTPKQIARKLGLRAAEVTAVIKAQAEQVALARSAMGELNPVAECLVNANSAQHLLGTNATADAGEESLAEMAEEDSTQGIAMVWVARQESYNRLTVCTYLVDVWCLGVKDTLGPRKVNRSEYEQLVTAVYRGFPEGEREITLEQAQAIVFSAVDYAAKLGFSPHRDFEKSRPLLGEWNGETRLECGRNGKPFYMSGPYDSPRKIMDTLVKNVGKGNFDYVVGALDGL